ncbi:MULTISPECIES: peptide-methionine (S)-S-oxide reductase [unclassified Halomonas]|uniref:peptide-methionine (S)-S-oxide reductase n=1 Tax=unclassified Halomonas TaxID=2609666 RepID=UPI001C9763B8|nr:MULTISPECIES: peptide-methionine (S)-S-oxide reductase [unclassified Halomonas]MBY5923999.1 peptide-methionine (S)-S-oxide reductase [Halomonas sp. DP4Y7-2]MBY6231041.1 peptide-methionine (S)-S-oxide reductase [Halomonas sp. DP4Y7-1]
MPDHPCNSLPLLAPSKARLALGGSCYWCLEAVYQSLKGVDAVHQGWVAAEPPDSDFHEAVVVDYDPSRLPMDVLIEIHLHTHHATSGHALRQRYRSAVYVQNQVHAQLARQVLTQLQDDFDAPLVTQVLPLAAFRDSKLAYHDYFYSDPSRPFCERWITPKLKLLLDRFSEVADGERLAQAGVNKAPIPSQRCS